MEPPPKSEPATSKVFLLCATLFLVALAGFSPALQNGFTSFDDPLYVTENAQVQQGLTWTGVVYAFTSDVAGNWHPLTLLSHMADCQLFGLRPWGHHLTSVLFHAVNTALVFLVLWRMTGAVWRSFFVAALFGLHPLRVESVAWVAERKDVLSVFFALLTLLAYAKFVAENRRRDYWLALFCFACGLLSKPMLVTLPAVLWLLDYWPLNRWQRVATQKLFTEKIPFLVLSGSACVITMMAQKGRNSVVPLSALPLLPRIENAFVSYARYLGKLFFPSDLCVYYPQPANWPMTMVVLSVALFVVISVAVVIFRRRYPYLPAGWFWFVGTLVPVIGLMQVGDQAMADRYTYFPMIGVIMALVWLVEHVTRSFRLQTVILPVIALTVTAACAGLTWKQIRYWHDSETLFRHATLAVQNNYPAYDLLAGELSRQGRFDEATQELQAAIRIKPEAAVLHDDLGTALEAGGRTGEAIREYAEAMRLNPALADAGNKLGMVLGRLGRNGDAIQVFQVALQSNPAAEEIHFNLGNALARAGRLPDAVAQFQAALQLNPEDVDAHNNLGAILFQLRQLDAAMNEFQAVLKLDPANAQARKNLDTVMKLKKRAP